MGLDPFYAERFAAVGGTTWLDVYNGDPDAIERAKAFGAPVGPYEPPAVDITDLAAPGPDGDVPVRVYEAPGRAVDAPCLVWMHGGAFQMGDLDMLEAHAVAAEVAHRWGAVVVSVDYRLVPAVRYPAPLDDCVTVVRWLAAGNDAVAVDPTRIAVGGASAGANLATATALRARDEGGPPLRALCLAYPALHRDLPPPSDEVAQLISELPPLAQLAPYREAIFRAYLGDAYDDPPRYAVPGVAEVTGLPPVAIAIAEYDDLRPSGEAFADRLRTQGVVVDEWVETGAAHGYLNVIGHVAGASATLDRFVDHLRRHVGS